MSTERISEKSRGSTSKRIVRREYFVTDICYENKHINRIKPVRDEKYIPTGKGDSGNQVIPFPFSNRLSSSISI
jgi:hypothetical protein